MDDDVIEYGQRLVDELPGLVLKAVERGRNSAFVNVSAERITDGIVAHSASLPDFKRAIDEARR